jgi:zinc/manganese transport system permease protein
MDEFVRSMTYPFLACLLLAGIHVYLGIHVIERKVIFVDLALAQLAALGSIYAILLGYDAEQDPLATKAFSLGLAVAGAAVFSLTRQRRERVPHEAIIGIAYAAAVAASILASINLPHGADEIRELLAGSILWVTGETVAIAAAVYAAVGLFHYVFREQLLAVTLDADDARRRGINVRLWDFLFYVSFAVVVTSSVAIAGVLLVFAFLVVPAVVAVLLSENIRTRLVIGWTVGATVSFAGVAASYAGNLPSGPVIVLALVACLATVALVQSVVGAPSPTRAAIKTVAALVAVAVAVWGTTALRKGGERTTLDLASSPLKNERLLALSAARDSGEEWARLRRVRRALLSDPEAEVRVSAVNAVASRHDASLLGEIHTLLSDVDDGVREAAVRAVRSLHEPASIEPLLAAALAESDDYLKTEMAEAIVELGDERGVAILVAIADDSPLGQVRKEAYEHLSHHIAIPTPALEDGGPSLRSWWAAQRDRLRWNADRLVFEAR